MIAAFLLAVPLLPLLAAVCALTFGRRLKWGGAELLLAALGLGFVALALLHINSRVDATWFAVGRFRLTIGLEITGLTWFVAMVVTVTAFLVSLYAIGYMADERESRPRFFAGLGLFAAAMLTLVLSSSFVLLFAGWELVGVASYFLIGFRFAVPGTPTAAAKAFLMTRIGDMGLLLGWLLLFGATGTTDIGRALSAGQAGHWAPAFTTLIAFLMLAGVIGKSAQLPLSAWLPDAMAGPTPVSALLHSATMVAAGVFLLLRMAPLFAAAPMAREAIVWIGAVTALVAALLATAESDLKRVLAWSTCEQLAEMMIAFGLGVPYAAAFLLATHAAFKATLFTVAGAVERRTGTRDLNQLGGLARSMPLMAMLFGIAALALAAVPPFSGYWSGEAVLAAAVSHGTAPALLMLVLACLSGTYISRAGIAVFGGKPRGAAISNRSLPLTMTAGMIGLALAAASLGWTLAGGSLSRLLATPMAASVGWGWRLGIICASLAGLAFGAARAWRHGAAPALGGFPNGLASGLAGLTDTPAAIALRFAVRVDRIEQDFDHGAMAIGKAACSFAQTSNVIETRGFGKGGDRVAALFAEGGETLREVQTGKVYFYSLGLFIWAAATLLAGIILAVAVG